MANEIKLANDGSICSLFIKKLDGLDNVMVWTWAKPVDFTVHLTCAEARKLGQGEIQAEMKRGGLIRLRALDGFPDVWILSLSTGMLDVMVRLTPATADALRALLRQEAGVEGWDAVETGIEPGCDQRPHQPVSTGGETQTPGYSD
jgi:hypothetical protein